MPDRHEPPEQRSGISTTMRTFVAFLVFYAAVIVFAGLGWKGLLHWTGEGLLITGILLAAKGISDVRREWTRRPGLRATTKQRVRSLAGGFLWPHWNRAVERRPQLARRLRLRIHMTHVGGQDASVSAETARAVAVVPPVRAVLSSPAEALSRVLTVDLVTRIRAEISLVGFWHNTYAQNTLRAWVATRLAEPMIDGEDLFDFGRIGPAADRLVELAKANHARLAAS